MTPLAFVLLSGTLTFGVPLALAVYEVLRPYPAPRPDDEPPPEPRITPERGPLPSCLLPTPVRRPLHIARVRSLELS